MNVLFFIIPKHDTAYLSDGCSLKEAIEIMEERRYTAIPLLDRAGKYIGTVTEGDLLRALQKIFEKKTKPENVEITNVRRRWENQPVKADCAIEDLISLSLNQNFVPVVDDDNVFIGIIPRRAIIEYCYKHSTLKDKE